MLRKDQIDFLAALYSRSEHRTAGDTTYVWLEYDIEKLAQAAYEQGAADSRTLLVRCRNMLSHPAHWGCEPNVVKTRHALYADVLDHLNAKDEA